MTICQEMRTLKDEKSVFTFNLWDDLPMFGDGDSDFNKHLESFHVCLLVIGEKLRLFARRLKGTHRRCYDMFAKEAKHSGDYEDKPSVVFDRVIAAPDAPFNFPEIGRGANLRWLEAQRRWSSCMS